MHDIYTKQYRSLIMFAFRIASRVSDTFWNMGAEDSSGVYTFAIEPEKTKWNKMNQTYWNVGDGSVELVLYSKTMYVLDCPFFFF